MTQVSQGVLDDAREQLQDAQIVETADVQIVQTADVDGEYTEDADGEYTEDANGEYTEDANEKDAKDANKDDANADPYTSYQYDRECYNDPYKWGVIPWTCQMYKICDSAFDVDLEHPTLFKGVLDKLREMIITANLCAHMHPNPLDNHRSGHPIDILSIISNNCTVEKLDELCDTIKQQLYTDIMQFRENCCYRKLYDNTDMIPMFAYPIWCCMVRDVKVHVAPDRDAKNAAILKDINEWETFQSQIREITQILQKRYGKCDHDASNCDYDCDCDCDHCRNTNDCNNVDFDTSSESNSSDDSNSSNNIIRRWELYQSSIAARAARPSTATATTFATKPSA